MSRLSTKQRRARRRGGVSKRGECYAVISRTRFPFWRATLRRSGPQSPEEIAKAMEKAYKHLELEHARWYWAEEITNLDVMKQGLTAEALFADGWYRCPEKDAWWRPRRA